MKTIWISKICLCILLFSQCNSDKNSGKDLKLLSGTIPPVIVLQPFNGFSKKYTDHIHQNLKPYFPSLKIQNAIPLPSHAYVHKRNRYRADTLISFLKEGKGKDTITVGLTHFDISTTKGKYKDYGIMGLGFQPGRSCVISTFRLKKHKLKEQMVKLALHEIGHNFDLKHCQNSTCIMRDAEGRNHFDEVHDYCSSCKAKLKKKGVHADLPLTVRN
jgi:archaemetzincin